ncbi:MAG: hypothetical protein HDT16_03490 [Oscillibacter sp.]|nr:hypothetical protein [Oscillibacter sp.]
MARIAFKNGDDFLLHLLQTADRSEEMIKKAIHEGARILTNEIRANLERNLEGSTQSTGALAESLGITKIEKDETGFWNAKIGFDGYDENGVPNQLKARVMESGTSKIQKRPFVRPAVNAKRKAAEAAMERVIKEEIKKTMHK